MKTFKYLRIEPEKERVIIVSRKFKDLQDLRNQVKAWNSLGNLDKEFYVVFDDIPIEKR